VKLAELVAELDTYFRVPDVRDDDWSKAFALAYPDPYWREYVVSGWEGHWNGLSVRGADEVECAVTCVFPSDRIIAELEPATFLFAEHPLDFADEPGFLPLSLETYETMRERGISFYNAHAPLDMHPEVSPSRLCAEGVGLEGLEEYFPICAGIPGGAAIIGESRLNVDGLADALRAYLGPEPGSALKNSNRSTRPTMCSAWDFPGLGQLICALWTIRRQQFSVGTRRT